MVAHRRVRRRRHVGADLLVRDDGEGSGDDKAAIGASDTAAIAYFPTNRSVVVDTTCWHGQRPARWYDPTDGTFTTIAGAEAPEVAGR